jgi:hypothetical protein
LVVKGDLEVKADGKVAVQGSLTVEGDLKVADGGTLDVEGELIVKGNLTVEEDDDLDLEHGTLIVEAGGAVEIGGYAYIGAASDGEAILQLDDGARISLAGKQGDRVIAIDGEATVAGPLELHHNDTAVIAGDVTINADGTLHLLLGAGLFVDGTLEVAGAIVIDRDSAATVEQGGTLTIGLDGNLEVAAGGSLIIEGELIVAGKLILYAYEDLDLSFGRLTATAGATISIDGGESEFVGTSSDSIIQLTGEDTEFSLASGPGARTITIDGAAVVNGELGLYSADKATISGELTIADGGEVTLHGASALEITEGTLLTVAESGTLRIGSVDGDGVTLTVAADATLVIVGDLTLGNDATLNVAGTLVLPGNLPADNGKGGTEIGTGTINFTAGAVLDASLATSEENAGLDWISDLVKGLPEGVTIKHSVTSLLATLANVLEGEFLEYSPAAEFVEGVEEDDYGITYIYLKRNGIASEPGDGKNIITLLAVYSDESLAELLADTLDEFLTSLPEE